MRILVSWELDQQLTEKSSMDSQSGVNWNGLEDIRKQYRVHTRNRGGKLYLKVYWQNASYDEYLNARALVETYWPDAYLTSCCANSEATFRLNPPHREI